MPPATLLQHPPTGGYLTTDATWTTWTTATTANCTEFVWFTWANNTTVSYASGNGYQQAAPLSDEEREAGRIAREAREAERSASRERAKQLLVDHLTNKQRREYEESGHFHVTTRNGRRRYRLRPGSPPVRVHGEDGNRWSYCIHARDYAFPAEDVALAQKFMLETDEERFLAIANATRLSVQA